MRNTLRRVGAVAVMLGFGAEARAVEQAEVDFSDTGAAMTHRGSGFLHSIDPGNPPDALVAPLKPQMLRMRPAAAQAMDARARALGVQHMQIIVSDEFNDYTSPFPGDGGDWAPWDNYVTSVAAQAVNNTAPVQFDIWNEPDLSVFWPRSRSQFFEAWRRAVLDIRAVNPGAQIVGPSFSNYSNTNIGLQNFLLYAKKNDVLPDVVSWHEYKTGFTPHVTSTRTFMAANGIAQRPISINEIVGQTAWGNEKQWQAAGPLPQYFAEVERADVQSVAHAAWDEPNPDRVGQRGLQLRRCHRCDRLPDYRCGVPAAGDGGYGGPDGDRAGAARNRLFRPAGLHLIAPATAVTGGRKSVGSRTHVQSVT